MISFFCYHNLVTNCQIKKNNTWETQPNHFILLSNLTNEVVPSCTKKIYHMSFSSWEGSPMWTSKEEFICERRLSKKMTIGKHIWIWNLPFEDVVYNHWMAFIWKIMKTVIVITFMIIEVQSIILKEIILNWALVLQDHGTWCLI